MNLVNDIAPHESILNGDYEGVSARKEFKNTASWSCYFLLKQKINIFLPKESAVDANTLK